MSVSDLGRTRFAFSPLTEAAESLYMLASGAVHPLYRGWFESVRPRLDLVDLPLLTAVIPARPLIADFLLAGAVDPTTTIEQQLRLVAELPADYLAAEIEAVWEDERMPPRARELIVSAAGPRRLADALRRYWSVAIEPHWRAMRAVLDDDVAHRANKLTKGGVGAMLADLAPEVSLRGEVLRIDKKRQVDGDQEEDLSGIGLLLVPSVFVWPNVVFAVSPSGPATLTYPARGVASLWGHDDVVAAAENELGALLGRSRAEIIVALAVPHSTTELALALGQSPSSVSQHLSVLRRCGLVKSWRSGRSVLYRRTDLATSIVDASAPALDAGTGTGA